MLDIMKENVEDLLSTNLWLALPSEFIATLVITLLGCGAWNNSEIGNSSVIDLYVSFTFGLAIAAVIWVFQHHSGGHANPAVTAAALFTRRVSIIRGVLYIIAQIVGATVGAGILYGLTSTINSAKLGVNEITSGVTSAQAFGVEFIITFVYVLVVFASQDERRSDLKGSAPLTIGLAAVVCHLFAVSFTKAGMNPARSFAPALIMAEWRDHWVFWVGPISGAVLAGLLYEYVFAAGATFAGVKKCLLRTKKPKIESQQEPEKVPFEEIKSDVIEIEDVKGDAEKQPESAQPEVEKAKAEVVEVNEQDKK